MLRARNKKVKNPRRAKSFKDELIQVYSRFKTDLESVCERYGAEINYWYAPSDIPQPKFLIDEVGFDADQLLEEKTLAPKPKKRKAREASRRRKSVRKHRRARTS